MRSLLILACAVGLSLAAGCVIDLDDDDGGDPGGSGAFCGGITGQGCDSDEFCDYPEENQCGIADGGGVCHGRPRACPEIYAPVRGSNGQIYGNACEAHAAGVDDCGPVTR